MLKGLSNFAKNDGAVKFLFDNIRNLGLAALVLAASNWKMSSSNIGFLYYLDMFIGAGLFLIALCLFYINFENALQKSKEITLTLWLKCLIALVYGITIAQLLSYLSIGK